MNGTVNKMKTIPYSYSDDTGYQFMALHRKSIDYDPRNSDNPIIQDYFNTYDRNNNTLPIYHEIMTCEFNNLKNSRLPEIPISFKMVIHEINMAWISIIHQMLFTEKAYGTFYYEYRDVIEHILLCDSPNSKESLIYRFYGTGVSVFHIAAKVWIFKKCYDKLNSGLPIDELIEKELENVLNCYKEIENRINRNNCILGMNDFTGVILYDYILNFVEEVENNRYEVN